MHQSEDASVRNLLDDAGLKISSAQMYMRTPEDSPADSMDACSVSGATNPSNTSGSTQKKEADGFPRSYPVAERAGGPKAWLWGQERQRVKRNLSQEFSNGESLRSNRHNGAKPKHSGSAAAAGWTVVKAVLLLLVILMASGIVAVLVTTPEAHAAAAKAVASSQVGRHLLPTHTETIFVQGCAVIKEKQIIYHRSFVHALEGIGTHLNHLTQDVRLRIQHLTSQGKSIYFAATHNAQGEPLSAGAALVAITDTIGSNMQNMALVGRIQQGLASIPRMGDPLVALLKDFLPSPVLRTAQEPLIMETVIKPVGVAVSSIFGIGIAMYIVSAVLRGMATQGT